MTEHPIPPLRGEARDSDESGSRSPKPEAAPARLTDPREMRKRLHQVAYRGDRVDGKLTERYCFGGMAPGLLKAILDTGKHLGWSGEDTMTALAYHALIEYERLTDVLLMQACLSPNPSFVSLTDANITTRRS